MTAEGMLRSGDDLGPYRIEGQLAMGGMATLWRAHHQEDPGRAVVLKTMLPHLAQDRDCVTMFLREAELAARFDHPNIVAVHDVGVYDGLHYIEMELIEGHNLRHLLREAYRHGRFLPLEIVLSSLGDACDGLAHVHDFILDDIAGAPAGFVHRDISPENLVLGRDGITRLLDFGVATGDWAGATRAGQMKGKIHYMAPEVFRGRTTEPGRDVYAAGVTLYELLVGRRPFQGDNDGELMFQIANATPARPSSLRRGLPDTLDEIFERATHRDPHLRCDALTLGEGLRQVLLPRLRTEVRETVRGAIEELLAPSEMNGAPEVVNGRRTASELVPIPSLVPEPVQDIFTVSRPRPDVSDVFSTYGEASRRPSIRSPRPPPAPSPPPLPAVRPDEGPSAATMSPDARRHFELGLTYRRQGRWDDALAEWELAARIQPDHRILEANLRLMRKKLRR